MIADGIIEARSMREAHRSGARAYREATADAPARQLRRHLPHGWSDGEGVEDDFSNVAAWVTWTSALAQVERDESVMDRLWPALCELATPGWRPSSGQDPVIAAALDKAWVIRG